MARHYKIGNITQTMQRLSVAGICALILTAPSHAEEDPPDYNKGKNAGSYVSPLCATASLPTSAANCVELELQLVNKDYRQVNYDWAHLHLNYQSCTYETTSGSTATMNEDFRATVRKGFVIGGKTIKSAYLTVPSECTYRLVVKGSKANMVDADDTWTARPIHSTENACIRFNVWNDNISDTPPRECYTF